MPVTREQANNNPSPENVITAYFYIKALTNALNANRYNEAKEQALLVYPIAFEEFAADTNYEFEPEFANLPYVVRVVNTGPKVIYVVLDDEAINALGTKAGISREVAMLGVLLDGGSRDRYVVDLLKAFRVYFDIHRSLFGEEEQKVIGVSLGNR